MTEPAAPPRSEDVAAPPRDTEWRLEDLLDLYVRPSRFFASRQPFRAETALLAVAWIVGINSAMGRLEQRMIRADVGGRAVSEFIVSSWIGFWVTIILSGLLAAVFLWHLGTWWYRVRLRWSGVVEPDRHRARVVYLYSGLVWAAPALLTQVVDSFRFRDYQESWNNESMIPLLLLVFPFWSFVVSYRGVRTVFDAHRGPALWWFVIAPAIIFLFVVGALSAIMMGAIPTTPSPGTP